MRHFSIRKVHAMHISLWQEQKKLKYHWFRMQDEIARDTIEIVWLSKINRSLGDNSRVGKKNRILHSASCRSAATQDLERKVERMKKRKTKRNDEASRCGSS